MKLDYFSFTVLSLLLLFPYVGFYSFGTDIQPWFICFAICVSLVSIKRHLSLYLVLLAIPFLFALFLMPFGSGFFNSSRSVLGYLTIFLAPWMTLLLLNKNKSRFLIFLRISVFIYLFVGLVQLVLDPKFLSQFLNRSSSTAERGVVSLTPEPTFYGLVCLFFILALSVDNVHKKTIKISILQIIFLAQASMVILFGAIYFAYLCLFKFTFRRMLSIFAFVFLFFSIGLQFLSAYSFRSVKLINDGLLSTNIFMSDASINDRLSAIFFSIKGFFDNFGLPNGFGVYDEYLRLELPKQSFFWFVAVEDRIMSFYGSILFELGFIGLVVPLTYSMVIIRAFKYDKKEMWLRLLFLNTILWTAIPLSFPFVGLYIGFMLYKIQESGKCHESFGIHRPS